MTQEKIDVLLWAWNLTWRQMTEQDMEMRERLRVMIPAAQRPPEEIERGITW